MARKQLTDLAFTKAHTSLPTGLTADDDGRVIHFLADAANGILWSLRYRHTSASPYKWEVIGAPSPLFSYVDGNSTISGSGWTNYGGPSLTVPLAGDYLVEIGGRSIQDPPGGSSSILQGFTVNGSGPASNDWTDNYTANGGGNALNVVTPRLKTGLPAAAVIQEWARMNAASGNGGLSQRWLRLTPRRVG